MLQGRRGHARVLVLTVIEEEFDAVKNALNAKYEVGVTGAMSAVNDNSPKPSLPFVVVQLQDRSIAPAQTSVTKAVAEWMPEVVVLAGIGGGVVRGHETDEHTIVWNTDGPMPGDVIVASYVHYAEYTKNVPDGRLLRHYPIDHPTSFLVQEHGGPLRSEGVDKVPWFASIQTPRPPSTKAAPGVGTDEAAPEGEAIGTPKVFVGEVIHVEGLAGDPRSAHQQWYLDRFDRAIGVDMESMGVARGLQDARWNVHYNPTWMCVRAVSDGVYALPPGWEENADSNIPDNSEQRDLWKAYTTDALGCFTRRLVERLLAEAREAHSDDAGAPAFTEWEA